MPDDEVVDLSAELGLTLDFDVGSAGFGPLPAGSMNPQEMDLDYDMVSSERSRADRLIRYRARAYRINGGRSVSVHIHLQSRSDAELLMQYYGGKAHEHGQGWLWMVANRKSIEAITRCILADPPSDYKVRFKYLPPLDTASDGSTVTVAAAA